MEIGGYDICIDGSFTEELLINVIKEFWKDGIVIDTSDGFQDREIIGYSSLDSQRVWDEHGLTDEFADEMVYIIIKQTYICLVVDSPDSEIGKFICQKLK